jgi:hypothetical protein
VNPARALIVRATTGCDGATGEDDSMLCQTFTASPMMFTAAAEVTTSAVLNKITGSGLKVINQTRGAITAGDMLQVVQDIGGFWIVLEGGAGGLLQFQFDEDEYETEDVPPLCANRVATDAGSHRVRVINAPCGSGVRGMDEEGYITVTDPGEFLKDRDYRELPGRTGFAMLLGGDPDEYGYSPSGCGWVITWINFFREITMIKDIIFEVNQIRIKREKIVVWDNCRLPDEIITGADCQAEDEYA